MTAIKFTVDASGDNIDALLNAATKEANEFYQDLPGKFRVKDISVSYDAEYYAQRIQQAVDEAEKRVREYADAHPDEEGLEVIPAPVPRYSGWVEFEYDPNQSPPKKTMNDVMAQHDFSGEAPTPTPNAANDPKYQDAF